MKRLLALLLALSMTLWLCACNGGGKKKASTSSDLTWEEIEKRIEKAEG